MGIMRTTLVLGAILAFMPSPPEDAAQTSQAVAAGPGSFGYMAAAVEAVADVRSFCQRKPGVCEAAGFMANKIEAKAKYSAKLIYEWANEATADGSALPLPIDLAKADPITTSAVGAGLAVESHSTLLIEDLLPEWREPKALNKS